MKITPLMTNDGSVTGASKTLLYGHHGCGKTTQIKHYAKRFGKGLVISGESGLASISDVGIPYLPFTTFESEPSSGYSFKQIVQYVQSDEFKAEGYKWLAIDSATELSQKCFVDVEKAMAGDSNGFEKWAVYERKITHALKWVRDLPMHVVVTALAAEETDDNGKTQYWPMLVQKKVQKLTPALFDHVFCLVRKTSEQNGKMEVQRRLLTDQVHGWQGKSRDPNRRLAPIESADDITELLHRISMSEDEFKATQRTGVAEDV